MGDDKTFKINQTVYTANNKTWRVDKWTYLGEFRATKEVICSLIDEHKKSMFIPKRCVFSTEAEAENVLKIF